ncbi:hypothetical protein HK096_007059, partial [Nowakowskiella sp. JEL0078]
MFLWSSICLLLVLLSAVAIKSRRQYWRRKNVRVDLKNATLIGCKDLDVSELLLEEPPLISGLVPFLGAAIDFGTDSIDFLEKCRDLHGDLFTIFVA